MDDRWVVWGRKLAGIRSAAGYDKPSSGDWQKETNIDRNKWSRWEAGKKPDYDGLLELAAFMKISMPELVAKIEQIDYVAEGDRTLSEMGADLTDDEFRELIDRVEEPKAVQWIAFLSQKLQGIYQNRKNT